MVLILKNINSTTGVVSRHPVDQCYNLFVLDHGTYTVDVLKLLHYYKITHYALSCDVGNYTLLCSLLCCEQHMFLYFHILLKSMRLEQVFGG